MKKIMFNDKFFLTEKVLSGSKTQTRRLLTCKALSKMEELSMMNERSCYEEIIRLYSRYKINEIVAIAQRYKDIASDLPLVSYDELTKQCGWINKMFVKAEMMPHKIRITKIRIERLLEISYNDCLAEGVILKYSEIRRENNTKLAFANLIDEISGKGTWLANPYVFVYEFELIK